MEFKTIFDAQNWGMPFHFWSVVFFLFGTIVGSFLNVVIYRLPLGQSVVSPPSHCPHCNYSIPWFLNIPLFTWLYLRGKCANCRAPISVRYFLVELLTGIMFLSCWLAFGHQSPWVALVDCVFVAGLIAATFIDFEHYIIPDEITFGGMGAGLIFSLLVPAMFGEHTLKLSILQSILGAVVGGGLIYGILRLGKLMFGQQMLELTAPSKVIFTETGVVLPDSEIPYEDLFYRKTDVIKLEAATVELTDRCYLNVPVRLSAKKLKIGDEEFDPEAVPYLEAMTDSLSLPREAMGLGDVKFMAAIGAFLGWQAVIFSLMVSSIIGSVVGLILIVLRKQTLSSRLPYGPYIAVAATIWMFIGFKWWHILWDVGR